MLDRRPQGVAATRDAAEGDTRSMWMARSKSARVYESSESIASDFAFVRLTAGAEQ
jgi:hypothetical protein